MTPRYVVEIAPANPRALVAGLRVCASLVAPGRYIEASALGKDERDACRVLARCVLGAAREAGRDYRSVPMVARTFARMLRLELGAAVVEQINTRNAERDPLYCASHDFCDANEVMVSAFEAVMSREPVYPSDERPAECERDTALMNDAWDMAKRTGFAA